MSRLRLTVVGVGQGAGDGYLRISSPADTGAAQVQNLNNIVEGRMPEGRCEWSFYDDCCVRRRGHFGLHTIETVCGLRVCDDELLQARDSARRRFRI